MLPDWIAALPTWLLVGLALGGLASVAVAGVFLVADRLYPTRQPSERSRVDGGVRRHGELRDYLDAIGEPYTERREVHGETVAFYLPERDVAITFDPQAFYRIERAGTRAVLCEHEMPGSHLGRRLPFETPDPDYGYGPTLEETDDPVAASFERLGLDPGVDPDPEAVRRAYRTKVKEVHPDRGGDPEEFRRVHEAYTRAKDHAERGSP